MNTTRIVTTKFKRDNKIKNYSHIAIVFFYCLIQVHILFHCHACGLLLSKEPCHPCDDIETRNDRLRV